MLARFILITLFLNYVDVFSQSIYGQNEVNHGESKILGHFIGKSHDSMDFFGLDHIHSNCESIQISNFAYPLKFFSIAQL